MSPLLKKTSFDSSKCVSLLELTLKRIKILKSKRLIIAKQSRDDVAKLLQKGQEANAVARVEYAFREENIAEAYDLLEQYCHLVIKRISAIKSQQECPSEAKEAIDSLIYAAPRCGDLQELQKLRDLVTIKYGAEYCSAVLDLRPECSVNKQIIQKLSSRPPSSDTRLKLLKEIAAEYKINWNYQQAVAASFKNEETSMQEKQKFSSSSSQVSKGAVSTGVDNVDPHTPDQNEPAKLAANNAIPSKPKNADLPKADQAYVAQQPAVVDIPKPTFDSLDHGGHEHHGRHKSHAAQNTNPSTTHSSSPKQRDFASVSSKKPVVGSPTNVDKLKPHGVPVQQVNLKEKESSAAHGDASPSAMHTGTSRQKDSLNASDRSLHTVANQQNSHSMYAHHDELKGQQSIANSSQNLDPHYEGRDFASSSHMGSVDKVKPASVVTHENGSREKNNPVLSSTADVSRPEAFVNPMQVSDVSLRKLSGRKSKHDKPKKEEILHQEFYKAREFSSKPSFHSVIDHEIDDGIAESLAAKQYMRAHKSYVEADTGRGEDEHRGTEASGCNLRTNYGSTTPRVDPYIRPRQEGKMDYKNISPAYEQVKETRRTPRAMYQEEEDTSLYGSNSHQVDPYVRPRQEGRMDYKNISPSYDQVKESRRTSRAMDQEEEDASQSQRQDRKMGHKIILPAYEEFRGSRRTFGAMDQEEEDASRRSRQDRKMDYKNISPSYDRIKESRTPGAMDREGEDTSLSSRQDRKMDYKNISPIYEQVKDSRRTSRAMAQEEEDTSPYEYFDREQPKGTHHQRGSRALSHGGASFAREREWGSKNTFSLQEEHEVEESLAKNPSTLRELSKGHTTRRSADSEFERNFADVQAKMESADRAAEAAKAAIDMVRMSSMRSKTNKKVGDVKDFPREAYSRTSFKSSSGDVRTSTEGVVQGLDAIKDEHERKYHKHLPRHAEVQVAPHQEQEPDLCDSGTPHFDNYSSYESSEEELPFYAKGRAYTAKKDWGTATNYQKRSSASYGYVDDATARRDEGRTRDVSKQRWKSTANEEFDAEPPLEAHTRASQNEQYSAFAPPEAQGVTGRHYGVSRRSR